MCVKYLVTADDFRVVWGVPLRWCSKEDFEKPCDEITGQVLPRDAVSSFLNQITICLGKWLCSEEFIFCLETHLADV